ncbi:hypothetical protein H0H81_001853 [Sphagnurus paluster]|uniref:Uncharacterized protein n=1 Tax=Sphagnurus paluster TaxID=117069 RepID=A0A9P7K7S4_9AGAR|nr:hypothetical protein H0H81_001853 [Sphagnurus paluster]
MSPSELEQRTWHAFHLAARWRKGISTPRRTLFIQGTSNKSVSDVRFIPGHSGTLILTTSKRIWDVFEIWDISSPSEPRMACEWSPRGATFNGIALNMDETSEATLAVSVLQNNGEHTVQLLSLEIDLLGGASLRTICAIMSELKPTRLHDNRLAISDDVGRTEVWDWRVRKSAVLQEPAHQNGDWRPNRSIEVVFAHQSILVVRASSICLFADPELHAVPETSTPIAQHSFGWIDGVSVSSTSAALSFLVRSESDDPWASTAHSLDLYTLLRSTENGGHPGYVFPPHLDMRIPAVRGALRCRTVVLGHCGTAVWIQPRERAIVGLAEGDAVVAAGGRESLVVAALPGAFTQLEGGRTAWNNRIYSNHWNSWTALDYDEEMGRVVLCSSFAGVLVLEL